MSVAVQFVDARQPLTPHAVLARGDVVMPLLRRVAELSSERRGRLRGVHGAGVVVLLGGPDDLPWVDGVAYLGRHADSPQVMWPTTEMPTVAPCVLERALGRHFQGVGAPWALWREGSGLVVVSCARALPVDDGVLAAALAGR